MRSKLRAITALTPSNCVPLAAQSRDEPVPYSSPPLVVAYALAGSMNVDVATDALGTGKDGRPVYLKDIWPTEREVQQAVLSAVTSAMFKEQYSSVFEGDERWRALPVPTGDNFAWEADSTYIRKPPFLENLTREPKPLVDITGARALAVLGDSITTDHISPAGSIKADSPAGKYLIANGVEPKEFNSYGARRGNHEVMMRGTFANVRLKNRLAPGTSWFLMRVLAKVPRIITSWLPRRAP